MKCSHVRRVWLHRRWPPPPCRRPPPHVGIYMNCRCIQFTCKHLHATKRGGTFIVGAYNSHVGTYTRWSEEISEGVFMNLFSFFHESFQLPLSISLILGLNFVVLLTLFHEWKKKKRMRVLCSVEIKKIFMKAKGTHAQLWKLSGIYHDNRW